MNSRTPVNKILILAAHPKDMNRVRLEEELRDIEEVLQRAKKRDQFEVKLKLAVRYRDIRQALLDFEPQIVHFSGHGEGEDGLVFEDDRGKAKLVDGEALAGLFDLFTKHVKCVVLNACYSEFQAKAIAQHIDYVIGMSQAIGDRAAIEFAVGFYDGLGAGRSFEDAYKFGKNAIHIASIPEHLTPKLLIKNQFETEGANTIASNSADSPQLSTSEFTSSISSVKLETPTDAVGYERVIDYTRLQQLLAAENWQEADRETGAIVLKLSRREQQGQLEAEDLRKLPCQDLSHIDQLWVKYSNARFGFSVQQRIWRSIGGTKGAGYEVFQRFGDRVGWFVRRSWSTDDNLIFALTASEGHLPYCRAWLNSKRSNAVVSRFSSLMSRLEECKIQSDSALIEQIIKPELPNEQATRRNVTPNNGTKTSIPTNFIRLVLMAMGALVLLGTLGTLLGIYFSNEARYKIPLPSTSPSFQPKLSHTLGEIQLRQNVITSDL
ncbi:MAG: GUN4 domain-containing protein [Hassallia sp. WJT32-NPBG1]|jgi:hypothetical protein|nr:GUN4 domain-containing protein [Hassallia sp. WJT32-NPBG1]